MPLPANVRASTEDHLRLILATGHVGIWELDVASGAAWRNRRHDEIFGYPEGHPDWTYAVFLDHVIDDDRAAVDALYGTALANDQDWTFETRIRRADGARRWIAAHGRHLGADGEQGQRLIGHVIDITDNKAQEERLRLVSQELNHRLKNVVAVTQGLVRMTARSATDVDAFERALQDRLTALGSAYEIRHASQGRLCDVGELLHGFPSFRPVSERIDLTLAGKGRIDGKTAETLALTLHELTTNAIKHGALSNGVGKVQVHLSSDDSAIRIDWRETGGPTVLPATRRGFGSMILQANSAGMTVEHTSKATGVTCTISLARAENTA